MGKILLVYASKHGQTEKIARAMGEELTSLGHDVDIRNCNKITWELDPLDYDGFVAGAPVHLNGYPSKLTRWIKGNAEDINQMPSAFFSVCLGILQSDEETQRAERKIVQKFLDGSGWEPEAWSVFAGALKYSKYNWLMKRIMRRISRRAGAETDLSQDYEYTDWEQVKEFALDFSYQLEASKRDILTTSWAFDPNLAADNFYKNAKVGR